MKMSNKTYDVLKWIALIVLPALAVFYGDLASIWGIPFGEQIPDTIMSIDLFLGVVIGISSASHKKNGE
jgi:hypothetical protein